jgi:histidinol-phosphate phosphatase family protein
MTRSSTTVVVPTVGRRTLRTLLEALAGGDGGTLGWPVVVVDDRPAGPELDVPTPGLDVTVLRSWGRGPAAARNVGWRHARTEWVSFLDDDVVPGRDWPSRLDEDLADAAADVAGVAGRVRVPLPPDRRPTDWERSPAGLERARWITADLSYRRSALAQVGGFDERFPRAFREDADLGLRVTRCGGRIVSGRREVLHPPRSSGFWASVTQQRGNADDFLMRAVHGRDWAALVGAPRGRRRRHVAVTASALAAGAAVIARKRVPAAAAGMLWAAGTAELAVSRIRPGPRTPGEVLRMVLTSIAIPAAATWHSLRGALRHRGARPWQGAPDLVLFDRDGTLVEDVPYNGDPARLRPVGGAEAALARVHATGLRTGVISNQSGVARGAISQAQVRRVMARLDALLGPFGAVEWCPHGPGDGCDCRKPAPGLVLRAAARLGVQPRECAVVGDIGADVEAARAAGARGVLVPTPRTLPEEIAAATEVAPDLPAAVALLLDGIVPGAPAPEPLAGARQARPRALQVAA